MSRTNTPVFVAVSTSIGSTTAFRKVAANWKLLKPLDKGVKPYDGGAGLSDFEKRRIKR